MRDLMGATAVPRTRVGQRARPALLARNEGLVFVLPAVLFFIIFVLYPIVYIFRASLLDWNGISAGHFVGLDNYVNIFTKDDVFRTAARNSAYWIVLTIFPQMLIGFCLAVLLNGRVVGRTIYRAIFYMPAIISPVVVGIIWQRIYNPFGGLLADAAQRFGLPSLQREYLSDYRIAIFSCIAVNVWQWSGFSMLLYLAGLQTIPEEVLEAAAVDGAGPWRRTWQVVWPMLRSVHLTLILLGTIGALQTFALVFLLTKGGPNHATEMIPTYIFLQAFQLQSMGYGAALAVVLLVVALLLSVFQVGVLGARFVVGE